MNKIVVFSLLTFVLFVSSCKKDSSATDAADKYVGNYASTTGSWGDFTVTKVNANTILFTEIATTPWKVTATVNGNNLVFAPQFPDGYSTSGTGVLSGNTITLTLVRSDGHGINLVLIKK